MPMLTNEDTDTLDDELSELIANSLQDTLRTAAVAWVERNRHLPAPELLTALIAGSTGFLADSLARLLRPLPDSAALLEAALTMIRNTIEVSCGTHGQGSSR